MYYMTKYEQLPRYKIIPLDEMNRFRTALSNTNNFESDAVSNFKESLYIHIQQLNTKFAHVFANLFDPDQERSQQEIRVVEFAVEFQKLNTKIKNDIANKDIDSYLAHLILMYDKYLIAMNSREE
jgi:hypothetical protein